LTTTGAEEIMIIGDFRNYVILDKVGMNVELIPHLVGGTANYPTGQRGLYCYWRNSAKVATANAFRVLKVATT
ncbi:MAG: phage major capsid protein, partial [bacterium]